MTDVTPEYQITGDVTGGTWQLTRDGVPITGAIPYNAAVGPWFGFGCGCVDHGRNCEPPADLCCYSCPEAVHQLGDAALGFHLQDGSRCDNPDLSRPVV
jgi:hypothetical protein